VEGLGRLVVAHFFETYEQHHFALPLGEMAKCPVELAQLPLSRRIGRGYERRRQLIDVDSRLFADGPPYVVDVLIMHMVKSHARISVLARQR
jgi:hypothetical protein